MNKQKLSLGLSLVLVLSSSFVVGSNRANASPVQSLGTTTESSGFSGDNFVPSNVVTPGQFNLIPGVNVEISPSGEIIVPEAVQNRLNQIANNIKSETPAPTDNNCLEAVSAVLTGGLCAAQGKLQIQTTLKNYQVKPELATAFIDSISDLLANDNVNVTKLNLAINNWNNIVKQVNPSDLSKFKTDPNMEKLTSNLRQLRGALKKAR
jgi:hypothetical protein